MDNLEFSEPGEEFTGVRINPRDCLDHLLLIWVIEYLPHKPTQFSRPDKPSDVIVVDVVDLDEKDPETDEVGLMARQGWGVTGVQRPVRPEQREQEPGGTATGTGLVLP